MLKRMLPRTLFGRAVLIISVPVIVLQLVFAVVFFDRHLQSVSRRLSRSVVNDIAFVVRMLEQRPSAVAQFGTLAKAGGRLNMNFVLIEGEELQPVAAPAGGGPFEDVVVATITAGMERPFTIEDRPALKNYVIHVALENAVLQVIVPYNRLTGGSADPLIVWTVGSSMLLLGIAAIFLRNQVRPIRRLADAAERFGKGQDVTDYKPAGAAEVRQAGAAFIEMRERIERQIRQRTEMLAGVSHDLRTPLTRMKLGLAMLPESEDTTALQEDVEAMEGMIDGYLAFARGAAGEAAVETDVAKLLEDIAADALRHGETVPVSTEGDLFVSVRPQSLKRCIVNLLDNARQYASNARIVARRLDDAIEIVVEDDGPGVPEEERETVFRPFYRLESSRNPHTGGVGLGLAIARDTVRGQGGDVTLGDAEGGGLKVMVRLPV
jgi:two-component system osmolarity sensor histidine kinase EnvZ